MSEIDPALVERMANVLRAYVRSGHTRINGKSVYAEAYDIVGALPEPVDPDLIEARKLASIWQPNFQASLLILNGAWDNSKIVHQALSAIKRGRELERGA